MTLDVKKSNSSNETRNVMTVGVENYGLNHSTIDIEQFATLILLIILAAPRNMLHYCNRTVCNQYW
jgi:hypothetical protein